MANTWKVRTAPANEIEAQVNELCGDYLVIHWDVHELDGGMVITAIMLNKREVPRPTGAIVPFPGGKVPFSS